MADKLNISWEDDDNDSWGVTSSEGVVDKNDFAQLLQDEDVGSEDLTSDLLVGDKIEGVILQIPTHGSDVIVELGGKNSAVISRMELLNDEGELTHVEGQSITAFIVDRSDDGLVLSNSMNYKAAREHALEEAHAQKIPVRGKVLKSKKGGFDIQLLGRKAFCPVSQIDLNFTDQPTEFVGKELDFLITKMSGRDVVVSRAALLKRAEREAYEKIKDHIGDNLTGIVKELKAFGALVEVQGATGMVHISQLSHSHVSDPADAVDIGQKVVVKVLSVDESRDRPRVSLSIKAAQQDPWEIVAEKYREGESYSGVVNRLADFGAFVELEAGIDGLIHLSEMSWEKRVHHPKEVVKVGDRISVRILSIDNVKNRISLSMKHVEDDPWFEVEQKFKVDSVHTGAIARLKGFGAIVELAQGVSGLVPTGALKSAFGSSYRKKSSPPQTLEVKVVAVDSGERKIRLTLPQLEGEDQEEKDFAEYLALEKKIVQVTAGETQAVKSKAGSFGEILAAKMTKDKTH